MHIRQLKIKPMDVQQHSPAMDVIAGPAGQDIIVTLSNLHVAAWHCWYLWEVSYNPPSLLKQP